MRRKVIREFNTEQLVRTFDNQRLKMKAIFESDILTPRSTSDFKGHQEKIPYFLASLKSAASIVPPYVQINVDPDIPAVIQLWTEIKCTICNVNQFMNTSLKLFCVEEVNGISSFSVDIHSPADLINIIVDLFLPTKRDLRDHI